MTTAYLVEPIRTPIGRYGGALSGIRPDDLAATVIKALIDRVGIPPESVDDVILGCSNQAGEDNRNIARIAALLAGLPQSVPGVTVNRLCASSLEAIVQAARAVMTGESHLIVAGGVESMSRAPYVLPKNVSGAAQFGNITAFDTALGWRFPNKRLEAMFPLEAMGETAENLAEQYNISRLEQDEFALRSHERAVRAQQDGSLQAEILPIELPTKAGSVILDRDEQPRADSSIEALSKLKPAFRNGGTVTAGNSSSLNDGAAAMIVASESAVKRYGLKPLARYVASGVAGVSPRIMGIGPVHAVPKALTTAGLQARDIGLVELNEAFAAQSLACLREFSAFGLTTDCVNIDGGAIAFGHPLGMSGARITGHLVRSLHKQGVRYGIATLCIGVGQGLAAIFEAVS